MKKALTICIVVLGLVAFGITNANAGGPFCLTLDGFCDRIQISWDGAGNTYGSWDINCDGGFAAPVMGTIRGTANSVVGDLAAYGYPIFEHYFDVPAKQWEMWVYGNPPGLWLSDTFTVTPGNCALLTEAQKALPSTIE